MRCRVARTPSLYKNHEIVGNIPKTLVVLIEEEHLYETRRDILGTESTLEAELEPT